jgi:hypothetical protein
MRWAGHVAGFEQKYIKRFCRWVGRKEPLGGPKPRWEDNTKIDLKEIR